MKKNKLTNMDGIIILVVLALIVLTTFSVMSKKNKNTASISTETVANGVIGTQTGTILDSVITENFPDAEVAYFSSIPDLFTAVTSGNIDAFVTEKMAVVDYLKTGSSVNILGDPLTENSFAAAFPKNNAGKKLCNEFNTFLEKAESDGSLKKIHEKWTSEGPIDTHIEFPKGDVTIRVSTEGLLPPFCYFENGELTGLEMDIIAAFAREMGYEVELSMVAFDSLISEMNSGKSDMIVAGMTPTAERAQSVYISNPYYKDPVVLVVKDTEYNISDSWITKITKSFRKNFIVENRYLMLLNGLGKTILITVLSALIGTILAFLIILFRRTNSILACKIADIYILLMQGIPVVVLLMVLYYIIFANSGFPGWIVAVIAFSLNEAAYISEMMRSGIDAIDPGQREAALALGYTENQAFFTYIFPQSLKQIFPVYRGEMVALLKGTAIVGYVAVQDLTRMSDIIRSRTYEAFFPLVITALIYLIIAMVIAWLIDKIEIKFNNKNMSK